MLLKLQQEKLVLSLFTKWGTMDSLPTLNTYLTKLCKRKLVKRLSGGEPTLCIKLPIKYVRGKSVTNELSLPLDLRAEQL